MNNTVHAVAQRPATYDFVKEKDILNISDTYTNLATLIVPYREVGVYAFSMAMTYQLNLANKSVFFRWRFNGGDWNEFIAEPKDKTDSIPRSYFYPVEWNGGELEVEVEGRKEDALGVLDVYFIDIIFERKG